MFYFKKLVFYFDYYEYGEKKKSCGYGKLLVKGEETTIELHIRGLGNGISQMCDIYGVGDKESHLGRFLLDQGTGYYNACFRSGNVDGSGLPVFALRELFVKLEGERWCRAAWDWGRLPEEIGKEAAEAGEALAEGETGALTERHMPGAQEEQKEALPAGETGTLTERHTPGAQEEQKAALPAGESGTLTERHTPGVQEEQKEALPEGETGTLTERHTSGVQEEQKEALPAGENGTLTERHTPFAQEEQKAALPEDEKESIAAAGDLEEALKGCAAEAPEATLHSLEMGQIFPLWQSKSPEHAEDTMQQLHEDKWRQLCSLYPVCHPFTEEEDYISIAPKDFVILRKEYQNLVSNSFLLHSFYNYHHVILGKAGNDKTEDYYIGVPGSYLEREKRVAVMFGFEGFAQSMGGNDRRVINRKRVPAVEPGAFGYYMRRVEI